jgi:hypothetical protein
MRCHALVLIYNLVAQSKAEPTLESEQSDKLHSSSKIRASLGVVNTFLPGSRDGTGFPVYCDAQPSATHPTEEKTNDALPQAIACRCGRVPGAAASRVDRFIHPQTRLGAA